MTEVAAEGPWGVRLLPDLRASGVVQMAIDDALLDEAHWVTARRYEWDPPSLSLGKHQRFPGDDLGRVADETRREAADGAGAEPLDVVRRPSGGRAVLHGAAFEWSFAVVFPAGDERTGRVDAAYEVVSRAMSDALSASHVPLVDSREEPYRRSPLCFSTSLRHDLHTALGKVVAVAQTRREGASLVHGSVLERRPSERLTRAVERLLGERWRGEGFGAAGVDRDRLWVSFIEALDRRLEETGSVR